LSNIFISVKADKMYPYLKKYKSAKVTIQEKKIIFKNVLAMMFHKLWTVVVSGTDNLLLSAFVGIASVGLYSIVTESEEHFFNIFKKIYFINYVVKFILGGD